MVKNMSIFHNEQLWFAGWLLCRDGSYVSEVSIAISICGWGQDWNNSYWQIHLSANYAGRGLPTVVPRVRYLVWIVLYEVQGYQYCFFYLRHFIKGIRNKIFKAAKGVRCRSLGVWQKSIVKMVWWALRTCKGQKMFDSKLGRGLVE